MQIIFDNLKEEYLDSITELDKECFTIPWSRNLFALELSNTNTFYILALCNKKVIGYGGVSTVLDEGNITNIAVHPEYRNRKIASRILEMLIEYAICEKLSVLMLELRESNITAYNLYSKFGFEAVGKRKKYYSDNSEDAILMTKYIL